MYYGCIITETVSLPSPACKAGAKVAIAIIDTTIKANVRTPVPLVVYIYAAIISPIAWGP
jgi:hypothetical protein